MKHGLNQKVACIPPVQKSAAPLSYFLQLLQASRETAGASDDMYDPNPFPGSVAEDIMTRSKIWWTLRTMALAAAVSLAFGSLAWGYDNDDYRRDEVRERAYQNGYQDGTRAGHYDRERGYRFRFKNDQWEDARSGYEHWMGSFGHYKKAYRSGYEAGYRQTFNSYGDRHGRDRDWDDHRWHDRDDWR
jgi:hypothetical protein